MGVRKRGRIVARDATNRLRYGRGAPRFAGLIWIDPRECDRYHVGHDRSWSGTVLDGEWDLATTPLEEMPKMVACRAHFEHGAAWEDTGVIDHLMQRIETERRVIDGCRTREEVVLRYKELDEVFATIQSEGRFRTRAELGGKFRESEGVLVHIDRYGAPVFGGGGCHRIAIARILGYERIPAMVGVVHRDSLS